MTHTAAFIVLLLSAPFVAAGPVERRTGIEFPTGYKASTLTKLGVRTKGPIKVYAVGMYEGKADKTFMLKMSMGVGAQKMVNALSDALKPRLQTESASEEIGTFEECLVRGLPNGASKGTCLVFATAGGKLDIEVDGNNVGSIASPELCSAFCGIYTDSNSVCKLSPP
mmetsp:Transcript_9134/g.11698  ORF Transcript_9134/g.11698 Transcript_9134/m.11698 type:complete len:168 (-) Transcript_9134:345-848(-)|eukprot:CAMPEP_0185766864 /NCGR_PEP_ID=MMETSP1174-20130828/39430_1 /TAXON_ID=35687 /ORGANISM="Dictyocha speculum, Strain CCMP1381" /LENGTH=167 /DNA_ID=CAMNT_0028450737 /DNA_START=34 /DNA_END=537 /DNA_ORIENTATION=+